MSPRPRCTGCGGPHPYDTSIPPEIWNATIRRTGLPDYLCLTCIVRAFAKAEKSFTATLYGDELPGVPIEVRIRERAAEDAHAIQEGNNRLRGTLSKIADLAREAFDEECRPRPECERNAR